MTYRDQGVRTSAIAPGGTTTGITAGLDIESHGLGVLGKYMVNGGRQATTDEQAAAIVFLASAAASNSNGVILPVDNGWSAV